MSATCKSVLLILTVSVSIFVECQEKTKAQSASSVETRVDKIVITMPVLAPPKNSRANVIETAKDFSSLMVLATDSVINGNIEKRVELNNEENSNNIELHPIYYVKVSLILLTLLD